eukprot:7772713-Alexandrium_andersonii.AAC.1
MALVKVTTVLHLSLASSPWPRECPVAPRVILAGCASPLGLWPLGPVAVARCCPKPAYPTP